MPTLVVGDLHAPATHPKYLRFCADIWKREGCKQTIFIGDVTDQYAWSSYEHEPDADAPETEFDKARRVVQIWHAAFPKSRVCIGNHDVRLEKKTKAAGLPAAVFAQYAQAWGTPTWDWRPCHDLEGVHYTHGTGLSGMYAYRQAAQKNMRSTCIGHVHSYPGVAYIANAERLIFGMNVGCGIDIRHYAFRYAGTDILRPILGCGVVYSSTRAQFFPMDLTDKRYRR